MLSLLTPVNDVFRRDFEMADSTLLDPTVTNALNQGEWVERDSTGKMVRVTAVSSKLPMQVFSEKGDFSAQSIGKVAVLQLNAYEADTDMFDSAGVYVAGATELTVDDFAISGVTRSALKVAASGNMVHAIATRAPADNGGKLRFQRISPYVKA
jgi:hypothetical protein